MRKFLEMTDDIPFEMNDINTVMSQPSEKEIKTRDKIRAYLKEMGVHEDENSYRYTSSEKMNLSFKFKLYEEFYLVELGIFHEEILYHDEVIIINVSIKKKDYKKSFKRVMKYPLTVDVLDRMACEVKNCISNEPLHSDLTHSCDDCCSSIIEEFIDKENQYPINYKLNNSNSQLIILKRNNTKKVELMEVHYDYNQHERILNCRCVSSITFKSNKKVSAVLDYINTVNNSDAPCELFIDDKKNLCARATWLMDGIFNQDILKDQYRWLFYYLDSYNI